SLTYGTRGRFPLEMLEKRLLLHHQAPTPIEDVEEAVAESFANPIDFPSLDRAFVPDDRVAVIWDRDTPAPGLLFNSLLELFDQADLSRDRIQFLQPLSSQASEPGMSAVQAEMVETEGMTFHQHDPEDESECGYLANTASGERIYLSRHLTDAEALITVGPIEFHPILGVRGTSSSLYPGLSKQEDLSRANARGHDELGPEDARPLRQKADEIAWLVGLQMSVAVIPAGGQKVHRVLVGQSESVFESAKRILSEQWTVTPKQRVEMVIVTVPTDAAGHGWPQVAAAIDAARRMVERNGRIVVLSELDRPLGPGLEMLRDARNPKDAIKPIERAAPPDLLAACRIAAATEWANVSLLSKLPSDLVDDLFMLPLDSEQELTRLIDQDDLTAVLENAQQCFVRCDGGDSV
ncbi:MAG: DUF2088 domain-containing protein, partial [Planctomycetaceae bacterium]|nr:DUF2088 domain-containing protein [Planctomycetaceae bacterium]